MLTVHLVVPGRTVEDDELARICDELRHRFGIGHSTIQVEREDPGVECDRARSEL